ncbi:hypothetical protein TKK_0004264 [Trichogramma kaykai]|uniref:PRANC domain-containing protein n=1 Tax=Trichogramma kaykai TaxID=54128 RepID=A0ABD2XKH0_9HYME
MASSDESNVSYHCEDEECQDDSDSESSNHLMKGSNLEQLKSLREKVNWEIEEDRHELLGKLSPLILNWEGPLPNLRDIFRREEIDLLIIDYVTNDDSIDNSFVDFVLATGYEDEPDVDENGKPLLLRTTAVHRAFRDRCIHEFDWLFQIYNRFDVNYTDEDGLTHFHMACFFGCDDVVKNFLELGQNPNILLPETGDSPLHFALRRGSKDMTETLLRYGADPNWANEEGLTPLHLINDDLTAEVFFKFVDDRYQPLQVNARDEDGDTPLHVALQRYNIKTAELLLKRGADPNLGNEKGATPLHYISANDDVTKMKLFFKMNDELNLPVHTDARDKFGRTPLQWAVLNYSPDCIDVLLDHGADLSSFVFPSVSDFDEFFEENSYYGEHELYSFETSAALFVVECLENKGYEMKRSDILTFMKFLVKHEAFKKSSNVQEFKYEDETLLTVRCDDDSDDDNDEEENEEVRAKEFTAGAKKIMISSNLSLYDLIRLRPKEAAKQLAYKDFYELVKSEKAFMLLPRFSEDCAVHLCEKLSRGLFRRWALYPFWELIRYRLPILCCEMIVEQLTNQDLCNICLAAASPSS